jgi:hypothetical protein
MPPNWARSRQVRAPQSFCRRSAARGRAFISLASSSEPCDHRRDCECNGDVTPAAAIIASCRVSVWLGSGHS